ncbi:DNA repair protein RadC [Caldicellulosiruptoraceae bacterium PP1]
MENVHTGHRKRLKERFINEGLDNFNDHQVLELLLFFSIPRKDTNNLAHLLLNRYGSLSAIFEQDPLELTKIEGIGENSAILLSLISQISRRYIFDKTKSKQQLKDVESAKEYIKSLFIGRTNEVFYIVSLDTQLNVIQPYLLFEGTVKEAAVYPRKVVEVALRFNASNVIIAHNHPAGSLKPSLEDIKTTQKIVNALSAISVKVCDHIIVGNNNAYSFAQNSILPEPEI